MDKLTIDCGKILGQVRIVNFFHSTFELLVAFTENALVYPQSFPLGVKTGEVAVVRFQWLALAERCEDAILKRKQNIVDETLSRYTYFL